MTQQCTNLISMFHFQDSITLVHMHLIQRDVKRFWQTGGTLIKYKHYLLSFVSRFPLSEQKTC